MAGMLPGVECARRRRIHQAGSDNSQHQSRGLRTRRSSFCLYHTASYESSHDSQRIGNKQGLELPEHSKLTVEVKQAKARLDEKLRMHGTSNVKRVEGRANIKVTLPRAFWATKVMCGTSLHLLKCDSNDNQSTFVAIIIKIYMASTSYA
ncbi:hypothetical protein AMTRI_Chr12g270670 [Amborella trichopoda]|uniref:uncharacterized protein LOC18438594 isoform X2 n=1 Tax=Amborella trichopoda TaxID=13333 RepID=UPI0009BE28EF|nr:uncharacterized protein LOC18438594 isoform X2 [Amborella trichopoda]|eukprot:XP_020525740.1 uncharacterized protein LOC18438594 isoform X2 [Amborella trichopoda]